MEENKSISKMKRREARTEVPCKRVKKAWQRYRNRSKNTSADGDTSVSQNFGLSLKQWAREQLKDKSDLAAECELWLNNK